MRIGAVLLALAFAAPTRAQPEASYQPLEEPDIRAAIEEVLSAYSYARTGGGSRPGGKPVETGESGESETPAPKSSTWWERLLDWLARWFPSTPVRAPGPLSTALRSMLFLVAGAVVAAIAVWLVASALSRRRSRRIPENKEAAELVVSSPPGEQSSDTYLGRALALAASGDHRGAIRELLLGSMSAIERRGLIRHRSGLTNRDYLRAVRSQPAWADSLSRIVSAFEHVYFGRRPATVDTFDQCLASFRSAFREG